MQEGFTTSTSTGSRVHHLCRRKLAGMALALAIPAVVAASPASAESLAPAITHVPYRTSTDSDQTWSGYAVTGPDGKYTSVTGSWTIPKMNCSKGNGDASPWIGIDGWSTATVEQIGIDLVCTNGVAEYNPWVEMYPANSIYFSDPVNAGDTLTASVTVSDGVWTLTESDAATGWTKTFHKTPPKGSVAHKASAEAILEDIGSSGAPPVPDFNAVDFSNIRADGTLLASAGTVHKTTLERGSTLLSKESALAGGSFSISWLHR
jgi:Peptidase A4 family